MTCPEKEQDLAPFDECYELLVLDAPVESGFAEVEKYLARPLEAFEVFLAGVLSQACGLKVPDPAELGPIEVGGNGELELYDGGGGGGGDGVQATMSRDATKRVLMELKQSALEHGAVESFLKGDLVWDFGEVKGVTTPSKAINGVAGGKKGANSTGGGGGGTKDQVFAGVDLKKVGRDGIVAPPLPTPGVISNLPNGSKKVNGIANGGGPGSKNSSTKGNANANGTAKDKKEKVLEGLRDDKLALRLARSLFK